jgi:2-polyprenyl-3-methyl-5-hydroxy-6-metoxy-1,4-benzoquinol methylase
MTILERILDQSKLYEASRRFIGASNEMRFLVQKVIKPESSTRLLDFGCGNGRLVPFVPDCSYVGVDSNRSYIDAANHDHKSPTVEFICADLFNLASLEIAPVDVVVCLGVLHHLDDETALVALKSAGELLKPGGRLVTMDPCFEPSQHSIARVLMALDRGRFVRHPNDYARLIATAVRTPRFEIWGDVYRFPYTHFVTETVIP